jgi:PAS domain S-box-containing protein
MKIVDQQSVKTSEALWYKYQSYVSRVTAGTYQAEVEDITYWQQSLFSKLITYALPLGFIVAVPSAIIAYLQGHLLVALFDMVAMISIGIVSLNRHLSVYFRKVFIVVMLYLLGIAFMLFLGSFGAGSIYLLGLSLFITLQFSTKVTRISVVINVIIYAGLALLIYYKPFPSPLFERYTVDSWISFTLSFLFLNLAIIVQIRHTVNGLKNTLQQKATLLKELQVEYDEKVKRNQVLKESESHYRSLFSHNPSPMWIFDAATLRFLQVNETAICKYGYSHEEFLAMTITDINTDKEVAHLSEDLSKTMPDKYIDQTVIQHRTKSGKVYYVEVRCSNISFEGKDARLAIVRNITKQIKHTRAIEKQNKRLEEIAFLQSHIVRAPLARIIALTDLIAEETDKPADGELLKYLDQSVKELDHVITTIVGHSEEVLPETDNEE